MRDIDEFPRFMEHRLNIWKGYFGIEDADLRFRATVDPSLDDEMARVEYKDGLTTLYLNLFLMAADDEELDRMAFNIVFQALLTVLASLSVLTYNVENIQTENPDAEIPERFLDAGRRGLRAGLQRRDPPGVHGHLDERHNPTSSETESMAARARIPLSVTV